MPSNWQHVAELLANALNPSADRQFRSAADGWRAVLEVLAPCLRSSRPRPAGSSTSLASPESKLPDPRWCAAQAVEELGAELRRQRRRETHAAALLSVARWWQHAVPSREASEIAAANESTPPQARPIRPHDGWRMELTASEWQGFMELPGLTRVLAEELRLILGAERFPFQRSVLRVGWRHGWFDESTDRDAAQYLLANIASEGGLDRRALWRGLTEVAERWCGRQPDCDNCPLRAALPAGGPISLGEE
ncbi:MAG: hypothetical protein ACKOFW_23100 [Planctomycetaceae bacterium]